MTRYAVVFSPEARDDLLQLYRYIAERSDAERAIGYIERIETFCQGLSTFPERGTPRDDLFPGIACRRLRTPGRHRFPHCSGHGDDRSHPVWRP
ncbi:type II toxin-antitoxin system RelE/ParE family toxin [Inquilinus sp.]|uniref:type II toxin-antitoxin system RelE/ParE family toxin n=1 Tax=Inquilinus sp. TaxID=1932117 RepID=UPI0037836BFF